MYLLKRISLGQWYALGGAFVWQEWQYLKFKLINLKKYYLNPGLTTFGKTEFRPLGPMYNILYQFK